MSAHDDLRTLIAEVIADRHGGVPASLYERAAGAVLDVLAEDRTSRDLLTWLADDVGPEGFARAAVAAGVLARHTDERGFPATDMDGCLVWQREADGAYPFPLVPLYRIGGDHG